MSEPLSAVEIEDVLSSIRRLVSEDLRPTTRGIVDNAVGGPAQPARPALILTPALRVVPESSPEPDSKPVQQGVASVGAAVAADGQDWEPETGDATDGHAPVWEDAVWEEQEALVAVEPSGDEEAMIRPADVRASVPGWSQTAVDEALADQEVGGEAEVMEAADNPSMPDEDWLAKAEAEVIAGLEEPEAGVPFDLMQDDRELTFDEEVLRDLVRDLIREELQGHLGERITRNIRKLVRAEIARALAVQDLT